VSLLSLSGGTRLELEAFLNSIKEFKPVFDRLASSPAFGIVDGSSPMTLLSEIEKLPLAGAYVLFSSACSPGAAALGAM
jgi:hypothetical protein